MENPTIVVPFFNGQRTIHRLLKSLPDNLPVIIVDDKSDVTLQLKRPKNARVIRPADKGYFSGAVNAGVEACQTDVLVMNQDAWLEGEAWLDLLAQRDRYAMIGDGVMGHPAWPKGYVQGTFMFIRRDAWQKVGPLNVQDYPLWGSTCEWQLRACRKGFEVLPVEVPGLRHQERRHVGHAIATALNREPKKRRLFLRTPPLVSVVMPCFNYGHYLDDAINSLVGGMTSLGEMPGQTLASFEIIIVDDASTDGKTPEIVRATVDRWQGIRGLLLNKNQGTAGAINAGIERAYGKYITILSADDMRESYALEKLYRAIEHDQHGVAYGDIQVFAFGRRLKQLPMAKYDFDQLLYKNCMPAGIMYPRAAWKAVGGYPEQMKYGREDWAFNVALGIAGYCGVKVEGLSGNLYRREEQNRSLRNVGPTWRRRFLRQLQALYPDVYEGKRPIMCCGRDNGKARARKSPPSMATKINLPGRKGFTLLEYVGLNVGSTNWWGPETGTRYQFGANDDDRIKYVDTRDVTGMLGIREGKRSIFRAVPAPENAELELSEAVVETINPGTTTKARAGSAANDTVEIDAGTYGNDDYNADGAVDADDLLTLAAAVLDEKEVNATSAARRLARESGISIGALPGTGKDGRVTKRDVENYVN